MFRFEERPRHPTVSAPVVGQFAFLAPPEVKVGVARLLLAGHGHDATMRVWMDVVAGGGHVDTTVSRDRLATISSYSAAWPGSGS